MTAYQEAQFSHRPRGARFAIDKSIGGEWIRVAYRGDIDGARRSAEAFGRAATRIVRITDRSTKEGVSP